MVTNILNIKCASVRWQTPEAELIKKLSKTKAELKNASLI